MNPFFNQGYHLYVDNFYTSVTLVKDLFADGVRATGTIVERRRDFPVNLKNGKHTPFKDLFADGVRATGTIAERRRDFLVDLKNGKQWAKDREVCSGKGTLHG